MLSKLNNPFWSIKQKFEKWPVRNLLVNYSERSASFLRGRKQSVAIMMSYLEELIRKEKNAKEDEEGEITVTNLDDRVNVI